MPVGLGRAVSISYSALKPSGLQQVSSLSWFCSGLTGLSRVVLIWGVSGHGSPMVAVLESESSARLDVQDDSLTGPAVVVVGWELSWDCHPYTWPLHVLSK